MSEAEIIQVKEEQETSSKVTATAEMGEDLKSCPVHDSLLPYLSLA